MTTKETFRKAFSASLPVLAGYLVMGAAFGILLADKGYSVWWAVGISLTMYTGSLQFLAVNLLSTGASLISAALLTVMVNGRYLFYSISMLGRYRKMGKAKPYLIFSLTDETYALVCAKPPEGVDVKKYDLFISLLDQCYWVCGCTLGALVGSAITFNTQGVDFAMTALFVVVFVEQLMNNKDHTPAIMGIIVACVCLAVFGAENFLIPTMIAISASLLILDQVRARRAKA